MNERLTGTRGAWLVGIQVALIALVFFGPATIGGWPSRPFPSPALSSYLGAALIFAGGAIFLAGIRALGANLTPCPQPRPSATLVQTGIYRLVRHPIYSGGIFIAVGWALLRQGWLTLAYAVLLVVFLDAKSRYEERRLLERFPAYAEYRRRVSRFVPFVY